MVFLDPTWDESEVLLSPLFRIIWTQPKIPSYSAFARASRASVAFCGGLGLKIVSEPIVKLVNLRDLSNTSKGTPRRRAARSSESGFSALHPTVSVVSVLTCS